MKTPRCMFVTRMKALVLQICIFAYVSLSTEIPHRVKLNLSVCSFRQDKSHPEYCVSLSTAACHAWAPALICGMEVRGTQRCLFRSESSLEHAVRKKENPLVPSDEQALMLMVQQTRAMTAHPWHLLHRARGRCGSLRKLLLSLGCSCLSKQFLSCHLRLFSLLFHEQVVLGEEAFAFGRLIFTQAGLQDETWTDRDWALSILRCLMGGIFHSNGWMRACRCARHQLCNPPHSASPWPIVVGIHIWHLLRVWGWFYFQIRIRTVMALQFILQVFLEN